MDPFPEMLSEEDEKNNPGSFNENISMCFRDKLSKQDGQKMKGRVYSARWRSMF